MDESSELGFSAQDFFYAGLLGGSWADTGSTNGILGSQMKSWKEEMAGKCDNMNLK